MDRAVEIPLVPLTEEPLPIGSPPAPSRPRVRLSPTDWVKQNLFATPAGAVLTLVFGLALAYLAYRLAWFALVSSDWEIVRRNLRLFMVGRFPADQVWRLWVALYVVAGLAGLLSGARRRG